MCPESIPTTPTGKTLTDGLTILFQDFRGQLSWGRVYGAMAQRTAGPFTLQAGAIGSTVFVGAGVRF